MTFILQSTLSWKFVSEGMKNGLKKKTHDRWDLQHQVKANFAAGTTVERINEAPACLHLQETKTWNEVLKLREKWELAHAFWLKSHPEVCHSLKCRQLINCSLNLHNILYLFVHFFLLMVNMSCVDEKLLTVVALRVQKSRFICNTICINQSKLEQMTTPYIVLSALTCNN